MTVYEHAMLGVTLALAAGAHRRHGWPIAATAGAAAALPDWDGLPIVLGAEAFGAAHRVWGHNLMAAALGGFLTGALGYWCRHSARVRCFAPAGPGPTGPGSGPPVAHAFSAWVSVGVLAGLSHLPADLIYGGRPGEVGWPLALFWPFRAEGWALPLLPWGDLGLTLVFVAEMFALYRWPARARALAWLTLLALAGYVGLRAVASLWA